ncbi:MAG TPA: aminodeoxychorismate synthase component I [Streptosporangiaceae bacterium]|nr:aminodeoxychorismate synthase component I [Streptosporangiaceae bacterium]
MVRRPLGWDLAPVDVLRLVRSDAHPIALIGAWADGADVISSEPALVRSPPQPLGDVLDSPCTPGGGASGGTGGHADHAWQVGAGLADPAFPAFGGGWIGYLGFGFGGEVLPVPPAAGGPGQLPAWWFGYYDHVLRRDQSTGQWLFEALWTTGREEALERRFEDLSRRARDPAPPARGYSCGDFLLAPSAAEHKAAVSRAVEYIRRGDIFQANICLRLEAGFDGDPLDAFCRAVAVLQPPYAAFMRMSHGAVASLSPELFLRRNGRAVLSRPIKGTHRRSPRKRQARRQRAELERSAKNRAENVMIVDLMRNDLSRVCAAGSVEVPRLLGVEPHPGVWHLVSDVRGTLGALAGDGDLIRATFPPGSVTGAPKVRAVEIIHELEATPREIYTGAVGYRSPVAGLELNVAIRTFEFHAGRVWLGSGGGIVADSAADDEFLECLLKAGPLIRAIGGRLGGEAGLPAAGARAGGGAMARPSLRPRPAAGVFTSLLVADGDTRGLADHVARLDASARQLFGKGLPGTLAGDLAAQLAKNPSGRLRITVQPVGGPLRALVEVVPLDQSPAEVSLRPAVIRGGLGAHKWLDRRLLADMARSMAVAPGEQLLIEDADGDVLETDRANVFAVIGGVLHTPPADGRLLPGVARNAVLRAAGLAGLGVSVTPISRARLQAASEVFVTNAVHGVRPVRSVADSPAAWPAGPVAGRMAASLAGQPLSRRETATASHPGRLPPASKPGRRLDRAGPVTVLIDNYDSFTYNLAHMLATSGCRVEVVRNDEVSAQQVAAFGPAGVVISPGPCTPADAGISVDVVRAFGGQAPLLGVCLGHQAIAAAFGARVVAAPRPVHGQTSAIAHDGRGFLAGLPQPFEATRYHSLMVDEGSLPPFLAVTATARGRIPMALRHSTQPTEGVQFHPESILTSCGEMIIRNFVQAIRCNALGAPGQTVARGGRSRSQTEAVRGGGGLAPRY